MFETNGIIYGQNGTGKTLMLQSLVDVFKGRALILSPQDSCQVGRRLYKHKEMIEEEQIYSTEFLNEPGKTVVYLGSGLKDNQQKAITQFITRLKEVTDQIHNSVLIVIDDAVVWQLDSKLNGNSNLYNLFNLNKKNPRIVTLVATSRLEDLIGRDKTEFDQVTRLCRLTKLETLKFDSFETYSGQLRVRFPRSLHRDLTVAADKEGVSLNQYINYKLARALYGGDE
jgi:hypothetical protein